MYSNDKLYRKAVRQSKIWKYVAWSLPLLWLGFEFLIYIFGAEHWHDKLLVGGGITFFAISVLWWWWAVDTIKLFAEAMQRTTSNFSEIKQELRKVRDDLNK